MEMCSDFPSTVPTPHLSLLPVLPRSAGNSSIYSHPAGYGQDKDASGS